MILKVPFFPGKKYYCAQDCALMILKYYFPNNNFDIEDIAKKSIKHKEFGTTTIGLAKALREYGLNVEFYCRDLNGEEASKKDKKGFFDKYENYLNKEKEINQLAQKVGVKVLQKDFDIYQIIKCIKQNKVAIPLINWSVLTSENSFRGHFIVITGFDDNYIYLHNPGPNFPEENKRLNINKLEEARNYIGTNKETIIAYQ